MQADGFADHVPWSNGLTDYDKSHLVLYARLLDADAAGAEADEIVRVLFGLDPVMERARGRSVLEGHRRRARWMAQTGYRLLLD